LPVNLSSPDRHKLALRDLEKLVSLSNQQTQGDLFYFGGSEI
jgi:hypothetical protein